MKKTITFARSILIIFAVIILAVSFVSCSQKVSDAEEPVEEPKSAYELLNDDEKSIYNKILDTAWKDPSSVKIIDVKFGSYYFDNKDEPFWHLRITATVPLGGTETCWYRWAEWANSGDIFGKLTEYSNGERGGADLYLEYEEERDVSVAKINNALKEHWAELGV